MYRMYSTSLRLSFDDKMPDMLRNYFTGFPKSLKIVRAPRACLLERFEISWKLRGLIPGVGGGGGSGKKGGGGGGGGKF